MTLQDLDPSVSEAIALIDFGDLTTEKLADLRIDFSVPIPESIEWTDVDVPGDPDVIVRIYRSRESVGPAPCIYSMHGGGYVLGSREIDDAAFADRCPELGVVGMSSRPPRTRDPLPRSSRGLLPRTGLVLRARRRARYRPQPNRRRRHRCRWRAGSHARATRPRPRRGAARLSAPRLPDARRPSTDGVQPAGRASRLESSIERVRVALVSGCALRARRRPRHRSTGPGHRSLRSSAGIRVGRHRRRIPRRGHRLCDAPQPGRSTTALHVYPGLCAATRSRSTPRRSNGRAATPPGGCVDG